MIDAVKAESAATFTVVFVVLMIASYLFAVESTMIVMSPITRSFAIVIVPVVLEYVYSFSARVSSPTTTVIVAGRVYPSSASTTAVNSLSLTILSGPLLRIVSINVYVTSFESGDH